MDGKLLPVSATIDFLLEGKKTASSLARVMGSVNKLTKEIHR